MANERRYLTTGQAARICSVTPDTVLKWIRSGQLPARRTAGGHHRIDRQDLEEVLSPPQESGSQAGLSWSGRPFRFCWERLPNRTPSEKCTDCAVYLMRNRRCYELMTASHVPSFCVRACTECQYYQEVHDQRTNVLVITNDTELSNRLAQQGENAIFNLQITDCGYQCSTLIGQFKPDFAFVDCVLGQKAAEDIILHLLEDPRVPFVRIVFAGYEGEHSTSCDQGVFARIRRPFGIHDMTQVLSYGNQDQWIDRWQGPTPAQP